MWASHAGVLPPRPALVLSCTQMSGHSIRAALRLQGGLISELADSRECNTFLLFLQKMKNLPFLQVCTMP